MAACQSGDLFTEGSGHKLAIGDVWPLGGPRHYGLVTATKAPTMVKITPKAKNTSALVWPVPKPPKPLRTTKATTIRMIPRTVMTIPFTRFSLFMSVPCGFGGSLDSAVREQSCGTAWVAPISYERPHRERALSAGCGASIATWAQYVKVGTGYHIRYPYPLRHAAAILARRPAWTCSRVRHPALRCPDVCHGFPYPGAVCRPSLSTAPLPWGRWLHRVRLAEAYELRRV